MKTDGKYGAIYIIIGTRAQLIKMGTIMLELESAGIPFHFLYTQQHKETIEDLIANYGITTPCRAIVNRKIEAKSIWLFTQWFMQMILLLFNPFSRKKVFHEGRGLVLTHGDTVSTAWAAIYGKTSGCTVMHVESGLRSYNILKPFPEELMRLITFVFSDVYVCPNRWAEDNLKHFRGIKINTKENPMYDALMFALGKLDETPSEHRLDRIKLPMQFALVSIHRYENIFKEKQFDKIISQLLEVANEICLVMVMHPATEKQLKKQDKYKLLSQHHRITMLPRQDFLKFVALTQQAEFVITDGGSNQEEMSYIGKPTLLFRDTTERQEGLGRNVVLSKHKPDIIQDFIHNYKRYAYPPLDIKSPPTSVVIDWIKGWRNGDGDKWIAK